MAEDPDCRVSALSDFRPQTADPTDPETIRLIKMKEEKLKKVLTPLEPVIMYMQGVLVWEKPGHSIVMFLCVNGAFWFVTTTNYRVVFLLAMTGMVVVFVETWKSRIWPEIRVPKPDDNEEGWTPVHPKLLSVPELCHHLAETWVSAGSFCEWVWQIRNEQPGKFCLSMCSACSVLIIIGHYIPGVMLSYIMVLSLLLWPVVEYHNINQKIYNKLEPLWMQLEYSMLRSKTTRRRRRCLPSKSANETEGQAEDTSESDSDIAEFMPSQDPETTAALARAVTDPDSASDISEEEATNLLGKISREPSFSRIIDEDCNTDNESSFMAGIGEIPAHDDSLLQGSADDLPLDLIPTIQVGFGRIQDSENNDSVQSKDKDIESMHFVASHFEDSDYDEDTDKSISHGLQFPDVSELSKDSDVESDAAKPNLGSKTSEFVSQTVTTVMKGTFSAIKQSKDALFGGESTSTPASEEPKTSSATSDKLAAAEIHTPSDTDADIADFEMLDKTELDSYDPNARNDNTPSDAAPTGGYLAWLRKK
ncbi:reticulophagy regulator 3-like [Ptychodera flava]|uniref:reticulophagy regulator 3-like n=1 Tax=Ptychodera flava TaxID=63121 RepID=UPI00396A43A8